MYTENMKDMFEMLDDMFNELAYRARANMDNNKGGTEFTISPVAGSKACTCKCGSGGCKSDSLKFKNIMDDIDQVIFNDPATIVTFKDGTKVCVKASKHDKFCKETGLVYAIIKRLYANDMDDNGYLRSKGLGEKMSKVIEGAFDQKKSDADKREKFRAKVKAKEAMTKEQPQNDAPGNADKESNKKDIPII